jgi:hypothetical protein
MQTGSAAFDGAPIVIHAASRIRTTRPESPVRFWEGEICTILLGLNLIRTRGQFTRSTFLHWKQGGHTPNSLFTGDEIYPVEDTR